MRKVAIQTLPLADELPIGRRVRLKAQVRYGVGDDLAIGYAVDLSIGGGADGVTLRTDSIDERTAGGVLVGLLRPAPAPER